MVFRATDRFLLVFMPSVFQVWIYNGTKPTRINPQASKQQSQITTYIRAILL
ncbi:hypothetical protein AO375_1655 [Moraxella catarrhalis]|nr:hypothetical protein AO375_1655 [Moraxella catarrhalis]